MPLPGDILAALHSRLGALEADYAARLTDAYRVVLARLVPEAEAFRRYLEQQVADGKDLTPNQIRRMNRYRAFIATTTRQIDRYGAVVEGEVSAGQAAFARQGIADARALVEAQLPEAMRQSVMGTFAVMPTDAVDALVAALAESSPLQRRVLAGYGERAAQGIGRALVEGVALGKGPRVTAAAMARAWGVPLTDALRISRTEHVRAHRMATMDSYRRNPHVVKGWVWHSALIPGRTCPACVAMHGTRHTLEETLDDHPNGLCAAVPETVSWADLGVRGVPETGLEVEAGEAWFARQGEDVQRQMLGPGHFEMYQAGTPLSEMVTWREDPDWGRTVGVKSLKDMAADEGEDWAVAAE